jgi:heme exporter protein A
LAKHPDYPGFVYYQGHKNGLRLELTVEGNLAFWARAFRAPELLDAALSYFDLEPYADMSVRSLSAGWQRRVALSRLILTQARLWLLDEPFANLDAEATKLLQSLMQVRLEQGGIICMATHAQPQGERVKYININDMMN